MDGSLQRITEAEIGAIAVGAGVLGTCGGGSTYLSALEAREHIRHFGGECPVIGVDELGRRGYRLHRERYGRADSERREAEPR